MKCFSKFRLVWLLRAAVPAAVFFSLAFALEGGLRWLGLFGFLPLLLAAGGVPSCGCDARARGIGCPPGH